MHSFSLFLALLLLSSIYPLHSHAAAHEQAQQPLIPPNIDSPEPDQPKPEILLPAPVHFIFRKTPCVDEKGYCEGRNVVECWQGKEVWSECFEP